MKWCLMSSDVGWHIRDKLRSMPKPAWFNKSLSPRKPEGLLGRTARTATSTLTQLLNYVCFVFCRCISSLIFRLIKKTCFDAPDDSRLFLVTACSQCLFSWSVWDGWNVTKFTKYKWSQKHLYKCIKWIFAFWVTGIPPKQKGQWNKST